MPSDVVSQILELHTPTMALYGSIITESNEYIRNMCECMKSYDNIRKAIESIDTNVKSITRMLCPEYKTDDNINEPQNTFWNGIDKVDTVLSAINNFSDIITLLKNIADKIVGKTSANERIVVFCRCSCGIVCGFGCINDCRSRSDGKRRRRNKREALGVCRGLLSYQNIHSSDG